MNNLTPRQQEVLSFLSDFIESKGCSPTIGAIQKFMGAKSHKAPYRILNPLEKKGYLRILKNQNGRFFGIELFSQRKTKAELKSAGLVMAGTPSMPFDEVELVSFSDLFAEENCCRQVPDDSMEDLHVQKGDYMVGTVGDGGEGVRILAIIRRYYGPEFN